jgi:hypothetical protein
MNSDGLWWVSCPRATFGIVVQSGRVVDAAPYGRRWCVGREWPELSNWLRFRGYSLYYVGSSAGTTELWL